MFHLGTLLLLGLDYVVWPCTVTILLIIWPAVADRLGLFESPQPLLAPPEHPMRAHTAQEAGTPSIT
jgi:hypothetical protein